MASGGRRIGSDYVAINSAPDRVNMNAEEAFIDHQHMAWFVKNFRTATGERMDLDP